MQLAGVRAMVARLLPRGRHSDEGAHDRSVVARRNEKLHREAAGLQCALECEIRGADWGNAAAVAGSGGGFRPGTCEALRRLTRPATEVEGPRRKSFRGVPRLRCASLEMTTFLRW